MTDPARRLSDKILSAFNQACDQRRIDVAEQLLRALELTLTYHGGQDISEQRMDTSKVAKAYERLEALRAKPRPVSVPTK